MDRPGRALKPTLRTPAWAAVAVLALGALSIAAFDEGAPRSNAETAHAIAEDFACPVCQGQSVAESDVVVARNIRREIRVWVDEGRSPDFIRARLVEIYGDDIDYSPPADGIGAVVWALPAIVAVAATGAVAAAFARRSPRSEPAHGAAARKTPAGTAPTAPAGTGPTRRRRAAGWAAIAAVAVAAGTLVVISAGSRSDSDAITGSIRATTRELLVDAQQAFATGDIEAAVDVYDEVLELSPANAEALAYKAWLLRISGDSEAAEPLIVDAVANAPDYPDARVFAAAIALDLGQSDQAAAHLDAFDLLDPPELMRSLVSDQGLREAVGTARRAAALERVEPLLSGGGPLVFEGSQVSVDELLLAADALAAADRLYEGVRLLQEALVEAPSDADLNAGYGWLLGRSASGESPEPAGLGLSFVSRALELEPDHPEGLVYRAFLRGFVGDHEGGRADLAAFDALEVRPADLLDLVDAFGLRSRLESGDAEP